VCHARLSANGIILCDILFDLPKQHGAIGYICAENMFVWESVAKHDILLY
jgi:hypothetical protein